MLASVLRVTKGPACGRAVLLAWGGRMLGSGAPLGGSRDQGQDRMLGLFAAHRCLGRDRSQGRMLGLQAAQRCLGVQTKVACRAAALP